MYLVGQVPLNTPPHNLTAGVANLSLNAGSPTIPVLPQGQAAVPAFSSPVAATAVPGTAAPLPASAAGRHGPWSPACC